jgi:hypothetical protein
MVDMPTAKNSILAALLLAAVCLGPGAAGAGQKPGEGYATDARSTASDAEVGVARRAYRAACERHLSIGYCECMTGGMAQELPPNELAVATAAFSRQHVDATPEQRAHVESVRADYDRACSSVR